MLLGMALAGHSAPWYLAGAITHGAFVGFHVVVCYSANYTRSCAASLALNASSETSSSYSGSAHSTDNLVLFPVL